MLFFLHNFDAVEKNPVILSDILYEKGYPLNKVYSYKHWSRYAHDIYAMVTNFLVMRFIYQLPLRREWTSDQTSQISEKINTDEKMYKDSKANCLRKLKK